MIYSAKCYYGRIDCSGSIIPDLSIKNYTWETDSQGHAHVINEAYDMFAIPIATPEAGNVRIDTGATKPDNETGGVVPDYKEIGAGEECAYISAQYLIQQAGSGGYDLQLVPFSPLEDSFIEEDGEGIIFSIVANTETGLTAKFDYSIIKDVDGAENTGIIFWITRNSFSHVINETIPNETDPATIKASNQLDIYRLSSGDYSAQFEFSPVRNRGVSQFVVDATYKPYAPFVRVCPLFNENGLYGRDFNDMRGLVCSNTNFSISRAGDAWATYERNNLNYQNAWKREVDYMDETHKLDKMEGWVNAMTGAVGQGLTVGGLTSNVGLGIGAAALSAVAGVGDIHLNEKRYQMGRDNTVAQHNENLANIKAQPNTLAATGANTKNNKVFPLLIYYSCSDEERQTFLTTLRYYGMTVNRLIAPTTDEDGNVISALTQYINNEETYIKGQLVRIEVAEDNHLAYEIARELESGIYITLIQED